jgi:putative transposase
MLMGNWKSASHNKYLLQYHLIFVCKYRKKLLINQYITNDIKRLSREICSKHNVSIKYMEVDKDHIHYMIETRPNINLSDFVRTMKSYTTYHIWQKYSAYLSDYFWKEHTFWTDGYFICSVGNVSEKTLKEYIENQG